MSKFKRYPAGTIFVPRAWAEWHVKMRVGTAFASSTAPYFEQRPMLTINKLIAQGQGLATALLKRAASIELDWDVRQKSRFETIDSAGRQIGIFLPRGTVLRGGDVLVAQDGSLIKVVAAPQAVLKITHCPHHGTPFDLIRAAYHLGNRHVPIELKPDHLKIEPDHVLADMLRAMHLTVIEVNEAFEPESGAYASGGHAHGDHTHTHALKHARP
jgi:urease accessory protein